MGCAYSWKRETGGHASRNTRLGWSTDSSISPVGMQKQGPMDQSILAYVNTNSVEQRPYELAHKVATELILVVA